MPGTAKIATPSAEPVRFGAFELLSPLGAGGMAEAFLARRRGPGTFEQLVCLKRVHPHLLKDDISRKQFTDAFYDEARIQAQLRHSRIVQVLDFGETDGSYYLALEYVEGCTLRDLLRPHQGHHRKLPVSVMLVIALDLCEALDHAHRHALRVIHRDLTPANILLRQQGGEALLSDFGIAHARDRITLTETGMAKGKVGYMSPEQIAGGDIDARTDLFALGVTLYEAFAGQHPFREDGLSEVAVLERILHGRHVPLAVALGSKNSSSKNRVPEEVIQAVDRLLAVKADDRPASAAQLADVLAKFVSPIRARRELSALIAQVRMPSPAGHPQTSTLTTSSPHRAGPSQDETNTRISISRNTLRGIAIAVAALAASVTLGFALLWPRPERTSADVPPPGLPKASSTPALATSPPPVVQPTETATREPVPPFAEAPTPAEPAPTFEEQAAPVRPARNTAPPLEARIPAEPATDDKPRKANLRIVVVPFGNIWVNERAKGASPAELDLPPGRYTISAGLKEAPTVNKVIRLSSGERSEIEIDLRSNSR